jgi:IS30 family transposase
MRTPTAHYVRSSPKGTDMSKLTQQDPSQAAYSLNTCPRQTLDWMTPSDKLAETLQ